MTVNTLELKEISKSFPGVQALSNVSLIVRPGTVHAICGECPGPGLSVHLL